MPDLMSFTGYARRIGVSQPYISQLVAQGVIPLASDNPKMIDAAVADAAIAERRDPSRRENRKPRAASEPASAPAARMAPSAPPPPPQAPVEPPAGGGIFQRAKAANEVFRSKTAELEYRKMAGELVEVSRVARAIGENAASARRLLERLPDRVSTRLAAESDPRKIFALLQLEIQQVCAEIADAAAAMPEQLSATEQ